MRACILALAGGVLLGLSAPGFEQWYLAWCGLTPLFLLIDSARTWWQSAVRGLLFGLGYNSLWLIWFLKLNPPLWVGLRDPAHIGMVSLICWISASVIYACPFAISAVCCRLMSGWLAAAPLPGRIAPLFRVAGLSIVWTGIMVTANNLPDLLLMPISALEYSQYKNTALLQACSVFGGVGLQWIIAAVNVAFAIVLASLLRRPGSLRTPHLPVAFAQLGLIAAVPLICTVYGALVLKDNPSQGNTNLSVVQAGLMLEVERQGAGLDPSQALALGLPLIRQCPPGLVIWTETALLVYFDPKSKLLTQLKEAAAERGLDIFFGIEDRDSSGTKKYNAAAAVLSTGQFAREIYHKRYLIPFGEFEPCIMRCVPPWARRMLHLPPVPPYRASSEATVVRLSGGTAAPLICGENVDACLTARCVKNGGQLIVNISNLSWFHGSTLGDLTMAMAIFRAVENHRYYVYAADTGPSFVVDPCGRLIASRSWGETGVLSSRISYISGLTWFSRFCP